MKLRSKSQTETQTRVGSSDLVRPSETVVNIPTDQSIMTNGYRWLTLWIVLKPRILYLKLRNSLLRFRELLLERRIRRMERQYYLLSGRQFISKIPHNSPNTEAQLPPRTERHITHQGEDGGSLKRGDSV